MVRYSAPRLAETTQIQCLRTIIKQWCGYLSLLKDETCYRREALDPRARRLDTKAILISDPDAFLSGSFDVVV